MPWRRGASGNGVKKRKVKRKLTPRSVHRIFATLDTMLKQAVKWDMMVRNPCDNVMGPKRGRPEIATLDQDGAFALGTGLQGTTLAAPVSLALLTAMRRGELLGLKWQDVDFDRRVVNVRRALEQIRGSVCEFKDTKTDKSRRAIPLNRRSHRRAYGASRRAERDQAADTRLERRVSSSATRAPAAGGTPESSRAHFAGRLDGSRSPPPSTHCGTRGRRWHCARGSR